MASNLKSNRNLASEAAVGKELDFSYLREQIIGIDCTVPTPFGDRLLVYCDYTASGRCLHFVEKYIQSMQRMYANTHTEDDLTGRSMTQLLHEAERMIKDAVNAGPNGRIIACGTGATGAIDKFQQLVGVAFSPATRHNLFKELGDYFGEHEIAEFMEFHRAHQPVVFVGPYEHHSNEISWREGISVVVEVDLTPEGGVDLAHLESLLQDPAYQGRLRIGSFSAASNVTGIRTPVHDIARLLHRYDALACFDYAACAPYVEIDMNPAPGSNGGDPSLDAIFISPHKFIGGPGSSGVLVFNERVYHRELPPTVAAGGTVDFVGPQGQDYTDDIEAREKAGTPGVLQTLKAALAFEIKKAIGAKRIESRELELTSRAMTRWADNPGVEVLGNPDPAARIGIISFNIKDPRGRYLHPKLVTVLLNDLFGIQSRAGCSCAGPYGHRLLGIEIDRSEDYREWVRKGYLGIKPGWCRVGLHYAMDDAEADFVIDAVEFLAELGYVFLSVYEFDLCSGTWTHRQAEESQEPFSLEAAMRTGECQRTAMTSEDRSVIYSRYLEEAREWAKRLEPLLPPGERSLEEGLGDLQFFSL